MTEDVPVSIVIPVWRDEEALARTLERLTAAPGSEVVVAPALDDAPRYRTLEARYPDVRWAPAPRGRAAQMNAGAAVARGRWLLFLHADSQLPRGWFDAIRAADVRPDVAAGAFRFALDSRDWRARAIELGVRLRVALFGMPYGDQALFVRRQHFEAIGGYRDLPLMEDVDLVLRLRRTGRLYRSASAVLTSARRWERDGWLRRSAQNLGLASRFLLGASPQRLAQRYFGRHAAAIVVMARAPWTGGKTRLALPGGDAAHASLREALFLDTLDAMRAVAPVERIVACEPAAACERVREIVGAEFDVIAQRGDDLGRRMASVFDDVFRLGIESAVVIGSDLPDLPPRILEDALAALGGPAERVVLGPAADGGYYLIGMKRPHPRLFEGIAWGTGKVFEETLAAARALNVPLVLLEPWRDIDEPADLLRLLQASPPAAATRTRAWADAQMPARPVGDV